MTGRALKHTLKQQSPSSSEAAQPSDLMLFRSSTYIGVSTVIPFNLTLFT